MVEQVAPVATAFVSWAEEGCMLLRLVSCLHGGEQLVLQLHLLLERLQRVVELRAALARLCGHPQLHDIASDVRCPVDPIVHCFGIMLKLVVPILRHVDLVVLRALHEGLHLQLLCPFDDGAGPHRVGHGQAEGHGLQDQEVDVVRALGVRHLRVLARIVAGAHDQLQRVRAPLPERDPRGLTGRPREQPDPRQQQRHRQTCRRHRHATGPRHATPPPPGAEGLTPLLTLLLLDQPDSLRAAVVPGPRRGPAAARGLGGGLRVAAVDRRRRRQEADDGLVLVVGVVHVPSRSSGGSVARDRHLRGRTERRRAKRRARRRERAKRPRKALRTLQALCRTP
mmetsp:Transcript_47238/g.124608  ORF Transcript_47238/g.124608 Transcript_47238/m.124608 type:complete len:339 (+) Transcript_47238:1154-2170(+)